MITTTSVVVSTRVSESTAQKVDEAAALAGVSRCEYLSLIIDAHFAGGAKPGYALRWATDRARHRQMVGAAARRLRNLANCIEGSVTDD